MYTSFKITSKSTVRIGITSCRVQVRYGTRWGPRHPNDTSNSEMVEILLSKGEDITHINGRFAVVIDGVQVNTSHKLYPLVGSTGPNSASGRHGNKVIYLKGAATPFNDYGIFVSQLIAAFDSCDF